MLAFANEFASNILQVQLIESFFVFTALCIINKQQLRRLKYQRRRYHKLYRQHKR